MRFYPLLLASVLASLFSNGAARTCHAKVEPSGKTVSTVRRHVFLAIDSR